MLVYSCFGIVEWVMVFCEVGFDACSIFDFGRFEIAVMEKEGVDDEDDGEGEGEGSIVVVECADCRFGKNSIGSIITDL